MRKARVAMVLAAGVAVAVAGGAVTALAVDPGPDPGQRHEAQLEAYSNQFFGVNLGIAKSSAQDIDDPSAPPLTLARFANGLRARVVTSGVAAPNLDMAALWPVDDPQWILSCNEQGTGQPGVQRINLKTGAAETIVSGITSCDPLHVTPWGTVIFGEEASDGHMYEMVDPLGITGATINRNTGAVTGTDKIVQRPALGSLAFEGIAFLPSGVGYYGDELAPSNGAPGGSYYKFVPDAPLNPGTTITDLADSPLTSGSVFALKVGQGSNTGQAMQQGDARWTPITPDPATRSVRAAARATGATGYYRPEDMSIDEAALARGSVRFCGNNTGREQAHYYGETMCITDGTVDQALANSAVAQVQNLVVGSPEYNMPDNIAYQPGRGNWIVHEDAETDFERPHNNDLWSCLDDGHDADLLSDGCLRIATLNDLDAEWTGGFFDSTGTHFYVSIQHNATGFGTILDVTGWQ
jgi:secreted PhoX family phosphatase